VRAPTGLTNYAPVAHQTSEHSSLSTSQLDSASSNHLVTAVEESFEELHVPIHPSVSATHTPLNPLNTRRFCEYFLTLQSRHTGSWKATIFPVRFRLSCKHSPC
jgi:hypothetical protein